MIGAIFGADSVPPTPDELRRLRRLRFKKGVVWFFLWSLLPVVWLASLIPVVDPFIVGRIWMVCFGVSLVWHAFSRCPRCEQRLKAKPFRGPIWLRRCSYCGFRFTAPQV